MLDSFNMLKVPGYSQIDYAEFTRKQYGVSTKKHHDGFTHTCAHTLYCTLQFAWNNGITDKRA